MARLKYVRLKEYDTIIIFPEIIQHKEFRNFEPISAGFCYIEPNKTVRCFGTSISLGLDSLPEDSEIATEQVFGENYY